MSYSKIFAGITASISIVIAFVLYQIIKFNNPSLATFLGFILIVVIIGIILITIHLFNTEDNEEKDRENIALKNIELFIEKHIDVLAKKKAELSEIDDYGYSRFDEKKWDKVILDFVENVLAKQVDVHTKNIEMTLNINEIIDRKINEYNKSNNSSPIRG